MVFESLGIRREHRRVLRIYLYTYLVYIRVRFRLSNEMFYCSFFFFSKSTLLFFFRDRCWPGLYNIMFIIIITLSTPTKIKFFYVLRKFPVLMFSDSLAWWKTNYPPKSLPGGVRVHYVLVLWSFFTLLITVLLHFISEFETCFMTCVVQNQQDFKWIFFSIFTIIPSLWPPLALIIIVVRFWRAWHTVPFDIFLQFEGKP